MKRRGGLPLGMRAEHQAGVSVGTVRLDQTKLPASLQAAGELEVWAVHPGSRRKHGKSVLLAVEHVDGPPGARVSSEDLQTLTGAQSLPALPELHGRVPTPAAWVGARARHPPTLVAALTALAAVCALGGAVLPVENAQRAEHAHTELGKVRGEIETLINQPNDFSAASRTATSARVAVARARRRLLRSSSLETPLRTLRRAERALNRLQVDTHKSGASASRAAGRLNRWRDGLAARSTAGSSFDWPKILKFAAAAFAFLAAVVAARQALKRPAA